MTRGRPERIRRFERGETSATVSAGDAAPGLAARRAAFDTLTDRRLARAYRLAALILRRDGDAQDAVHDAAVLAWTRFDELRDHARFDAWFDRIVVNECRRRLRRGRVRALVLEDPGTPSMADGTSDRAERDALRRALDQLTPEHRAVVVLRHLDGHSIGEIAARTGEREGTVKSRLHYALRELRAAYDAVDRGPEGHR
ncbi:MAG TPA: RNA polymerase sigma factor [Candidatus Limnocylindrales bacterium]|nr:RNA polymerase sigma factor [Candidatus Limnocylindrales bacterium]